VIVHLSREFNTNLRKLSSESLSANIKLKETTVNLTKLATVAAAVSMDLVLLVQANPATAQAAPATILTCQQMSDTYGVTHNKTWGTATAAIQDQWMKKGCTTIAQAKPAIAQTSVPKPNSQSKVAPMQVMSQQAAPMSRSATQPVTPSTVPPKPNSPPKVAPMQVMSQQAAPMSRSATQPVTPAAVPPKKQ
jgi:hypothetical protein